MFYFRNRSNRSKLSTLPFLCSTLCILRCRGVRLNKIIRSMKQLNRARFGFGSQHCCKVRVLQPGNPLGLYLTIWLDKKFKVFYFIDSIEQTRSDVVFSSLNLIAKFLNNFDIESTEIIKSDCRKTVIFTPKI